MRPARTKPQRPDMAAASPATAIGIVLLYHRVAEPPTDPQLLCVSPRHFAEHLEILRRQVRPLSLADLVRRSDESDLEGRSAAITFDDGYADNLHNARPVLEQHDARATVFVVGAAVGSRREFWWDELDRLLLQAGKLPRAVRLTVGDRRFEFDLGQAATYTTDEAIHLTSWNVTAAENPTQRHELYRHLCEFLRPLSAPQRKAALGELAQQAGADPAGRPSHLPLSCDELHQLAADDLIEIGAHTLHHSLLSALPEDAQRREIVESKLMLENLVGREITSFSYPYGGRRDYSPATEALVRDAGFHQACSNFAGLVRRGTDRWQLPRLLVRDWDGDEFARHLRKALGHG